jgi:hypothetical protein
VLRACPANIRIVEDSKPDYPFAWLRCRGSRLGLSAEKNGPIMAILAIRADHLRGQ